VALLTPFGLAISGDRTGPFTQMSSRMLAIFHVKRAKGIGCAVGADITASARCRTHSPAGDSLSRKTAGNTCSPVSVFATTLALGTSQAKESQT